jgi:PKD repeat protein
VTVPESQAPSADFEFQEVENRRVLFRDKSTHEPTSWEWSFGDGGTSREQNPDHTYSFSGTYTVGLTVGNLVGRSTTTQFVTVRGPLAADFSVRFNGRTAIFTDLSSGGPTSFEWNFGDNSAKSTERNPVHPYAEARTYTVTLTVMRPVSGGGSAMEQAGVTKTIQVH